MRYDPATGARSNENTPGGARILSGFDWLRRTSLAADARIDLGLPGAEDVLVDFDAERGTAVRIEAKYRAEP